MEKPIVPPRARRQPRLERDEASARTQDAGRFTEKEDRILKMVERVDKKESIETAIRIRKVVGITDQIEPREHLDVRLHN